MINTRTPTNEKVKKELAIQKNNAEIDIKFDANDQLNSMVCTSSPVALLSKRATVFSQHHMFVKPPLILIFQLCKLHEMLWSSGLRHNSRLM